LLKTKKQLRRSLGMQFFYSLDGDSEIRGQRNTEKLYLGIEIEIEHVEGRPQKSRAYTEELISQRVKNGFFDPGTDGSLDISGIEIRTSPATWGWLRGNRDFLEKYLFSRSTEFVGSHRTGMHVHVSMDKVSSSQSLHILSFVYKNPRMMRYLSGRLVNSIFANHYPGDQGLWELVSMAHSEGRKGGSKSLAVSFHELGTMEFRMFQGTLRENDFWAQVGTAHAVVNLVQKLDKCPSMDEFVEYCMESGLYPELCKKLAAFDGAIEEPGEGRVPEIVKILGMSKHDMGVEKLGKSLKSQGVHCCESCTRELYNTILEFRKAA
jgi:hypothetical protein